VRLLHNTGKTSALDRAQSRTRESAVDSAHLAKEAVRKVKEVMHSGASWVGPETPVTELAEKMRKEDIGAIPVGENDRLIGMVTDRDIVIRGLSGESDPLHLSARDVMSKPIVVVQRQRGARRRRPDHGEQADKAAAGDRRTQADGRHAEPGRRCGQGAACNLQRNIAVRFRPSRLTG
jgi:hypothetical protein